jgi:hypothetical protein
LFALFIRWIPQVAMFEVKAILPGAQPSHHRHPLGERREEPAPAVVPGAPPSGEASRHHHPHGELHGEPALAPKEA